MRVGVLTGWGRDEPPPGQMKGPARWQALSSGAFHCAASYLRQTSLYYCAQVSLNTRRKFPPITFLTSSRLNPLLRSASTMLG